MNVKRKGMVTKSKQLVRRVAPDWLVARRAIRSWNRADAQAWPLAELRGRPGLEPYEYSQHSQNGEDGILRRLFEEVGFKTRRFIEFGFGLTENNALRLALRESFAGVYVDGNQRTVHLMNLAAKTRPLRNVTAICRFLNLENIRATVEEARGPGGGDIDLLSIDVDGNDYWFWDALDSFARVVVIEYNASFGPSRSVTVPYDPLFDRNRMHPSGFYHGASLEALARLARRRGYALVGCDSRGVNAFFVRSDAMAGLRDVDAMTAFRLHQGRLRAGYTLEEQVRIVQDMPYVDIE